MIFGPAAKMIMNDKTYSVGAVPKTARGTSSAGPVKRACRTGVSQQ